MLARRKKYLEANNGTYKGDMRNELPYGYGIYKNQDKTVYMYTSDPVNRIAYGHIHYEDGDHYIGDLKNFSRHGFGKTTKDEYELFAKYEDNIPITLYQNDHGDKFCGQAMSTDE